MKNDETVIVDGKTFYNATAAEIYVKNKKSKSYLTSFLLRFLLCFIGFLLVITLFSSGYSFDFGYAVLASVKYAFMTVFSIDFADFIFKKIRNIKFNSVSKDQRKDAYLRAMEEIETDSMDKFVKAQAIEKSNGDASKIQSIYISLRTKELTSKK